MNSLKLLLISSALAFVAVSAAQADPAGSYKLAIGAKATCAVTLAADGTANFTGACDQGSDVARWQAKASGVELKKASGETVAMLSGKTARGRAFGRQIAFNVIPVIDSLEADGVSREERRLWEETRRVLNLPALEINATAVRVPVFFGHSLAVHAAFQRQFDLGEALNVLQRGSGLAVIDPESDDEFPTPATLANAPDRVYVGRIRADLTRDRGLNFWVVADNVRKCAAHNAVSVAQILVNRSQ